MDKNIFSGLISAPPTFNLSAFCRCSLVVIAVANLSTAVWVGLPLEGAGAGAVAANLYGPKNICVSSDSKGCVVVVSKETATVGSPMWI